jgi:hypothetical protein
MAKGGQVGWFFQSHPNVDFVVNYTKTENGWYRYDILAAMKNADGVKYLKSNTKLSLMAKGQRGSLSIWTYDSKGVGYLCKD